MCVLTYVLHNIKEVDCLQDTIFCSYPAKSKFGHNYKKSLPNMTGLARMHCISYNFTIFFSAEGT